MKLNNRNSGKVTIIFGVSNFKLFHDCTCLILETCCLPFRQDSLLEEHMSVCYL